MNYRRVNHEDRLRIKENLDNGNSKSWIADKLGFHRSTIGRELERNSGGRGYRPKQADRLAECRQEYRLVPRKMNLKMCRRVEKKLKLKWSPQQIALKMRRDLGKDNCVSAETIYKHVYRDSKIGGNLWRNLRRSKRRRYRRFPSEDRRGQIQNARPISERSKSANKRKKKGHWERDTMLGKNRKNVVLVFTDRKTRYNRFSKLSRRLAPAITQRSIKILRGLPVRSITNDRGQEFADHQRLEKKIGKPVYFCEPYSSYQRGSNENRIGILRQYIPKGTDITRLHGRTLQRYEKEINDRPMKCLDWRSPNELMFGKRCATKW